MTSLSRDSLLLLETADPLNEPSDAEVQAYAAFLGIRSNESHLLWIARRGLQQALPPPWQLIHKVKSGSKIYRNTETDLTQKINPVDELNRELVRLHQEASSEGLKHTLSLQHEEITAATKSASTGRGTVTADDTSVGDHHCRSCSYTGSSIDSTFRSSSSSSDDCSNIGIKLKHCCSGNCNNCSNRNVSTQPSRGHSLQGPEFIDSIKQPLVTTERISSGKGSLDGVDGEMHASSYSKFAYALSKPTIYPDRSVREQLLQRRGFNGYDKGHALSDNLEDDISTHRGNCHRRGMTSVHSNNGSYTCLSVGDAEKFQHKPWVEALQGFEHAEEVHQSAKSAKAAVALALLEEQKAMQAPNAVALPRYCDPFGNFSFYRGQVMTIDTAVTSSRHPLTPTFQHKPQEQQQKQHSSPPPTSHSRKGAMQLPCGLGVQLAERGQRSSGCFVRGVQHGHGVQRRPDGSVAYAGEYMGGERHGLGSCFDKIGALSHSGSWYRDAPRVLVAGPTSVSQDSTSVAAAEVALDSSPTKTASAGFTGTDSTCKVGLTPLPPPFTSPPRPTRPAQRPSPPAPAKTAYRPSIESADGSWRSPPQSPLVRRRRIVSVGASGQRTLIESPSCSFTQHDECKCVETTAIKTRGDILQTSPVHRAGVASQTASTPSFSNIPAFAASPSSRCASGSSKFSDRETLMEVARAFSDPDKGHCWEYEYWMHWGSARPLRDWEGVSVASKATARLPTSIEDHSFTKSLISEPKCTYCTSARGKTKAKSSAVVVKLDLSAMGLRAGDCSKVTLEIFSKAKRSEYDTLFMGEVDNGTGSSSNAPIGFGVPVPRALASLRSMCELNLCGLGLTGQVPENFALLGGTLARLNLSGNKLTGRLDAEQPWASLTRLERLGLADNCLNVLPIHPAAVLVWSGSGLAVNDCRSHSDSSSIGGDSTHISSGSNMPSSTPIQSPPTSTSFEQPLSSGRYKDTARFNSTLSTKSVGAVRNSKSTVTIERHHSAKGKGRSSICNSTKNSVLPVDAGKLLYLNLRGNLRPRSIEIQLNTHWGHAASENSFSWDDTDSCDNSSNIGNKRSNVNVSKHPATADDSWIAGVVEADLVGDPCSLLGKLAYWYRNRSSMNREVQ